MSPFGAVRIHRGLSSPDANISTLNPAGATGHAFSGRATTSGPFCADSVANGCGRSFTVILRIVPGFSYRKSVNGGFGGAPFKVPGAGSDEAAGTRCSTCRRRSRSGPSYLARREGFHVANDLPPLLFRQKRPRGHPIVFVAFGDEPKDFALAHAFQLAVDKRRDIARPFSCFAMTRQAVSRVSRFSGVNCGLLTFDRILLRFG